MTGQKRKSKILDVGAGVFPHPRATHAVDAINKKSVYNVSKKDFDEYKQDYKNEYNRSLERKLKSLNYKFGINYNTQRLPYPNNSFDKIYSNGSLGTYGKLHAFKEVFRILKHGGKLEYGSINGTKKELETKLKIPAAAGFVNIRPVGIIKESQTKFIIVTVVAKKP